MDRENIWSAEEKENFGQRGRRRTLKKNDKNIRGRQIFGQRRRRRADKEKTKHIMEKEKVMTDRQTDNISFCRLDPFCGMHNLPYILKGDSKLNLLDGNSK